jgi:predicted DNA-binding protein (UPF0251 family)
MRGKQITAAQIEAIKAVYAETRSFTEAGRAAGVSRQTAREYVKTADDFAEIRREKRADIIAQIAEVRALYVAHLAKPDILAATTSKDAAVIVGILSDKHQLLSGQPTERHEFIDDDRVAIAHRMDELATRRRAKALAFEPDADPGEAAAL